MKRKAVGITFLSTAMRNEIDSIITPETGGGFEVWTKDAPAFPEGWYLFPRQNGKGTKINQAISPDKVKDGKSSLEIQADDDRKGQLFFTFPEDKLYFLLGKEVVVEGWVRSENKIPENLYISIISIDNKNNLESRAYYNNDGNWERLKLTYGVPENALGLYLRCTVGAGASACFDGINFKIDTVTDSKLSK
jgi:hypothetical protein